MSPNEMSQRFSVRKIAFGAVALAAVALLASVTLGGEAAPASGSNGASDPGPAATTVVPTFIPPNGVNINDQWVLMPPTATDDNTIDSATAIKTASEYAENGVQPEALLARVTVPGTIPPPDRDVKFNNPLQDEQAWVVTFTSPEPMVFGGKYGSESDGITVTHFSVVLDADSGAFLIGFYTK